MCTSLLKAYKQSTILIQGLNGLSEDQPKVSITVDQEFYPTLNRT